MLKFKRMNYFLKLTVKRLVKLIIKEAFIDTLKLAFQQLKTES